MPPTTPRPSPGTDRAADAVPVPGPAGVSDLADCSRSAVALLGAWDNETERGDTSPDLLTGLFGGEPRGVPELLVGLLLIADDLLDEVAAATGAARDDVLRDLERRWSLPGPAD